MGTRMQPGWDIMCDARESGVCMGPAQGMGGGCGSSARQRLSLPAHRTAWPAGGVQGQAEGEQRAAGEEGDRAGRAAGARRSAGGRSPGDATLLNALQSTLLSPTPTNTLLQGARVVRVEATQPCQACADNGPDKNPQLLPPSPESARLFCLPPPRRVRRSAATRCQVAEWKNTVACGAGRRRGSRATRSGAGCCAQALPCTPCRAGLRLAPPSPPSPPAS